MTNAKVTRVVRWGMVGVLLIAAVLRLAALPELPLGLHYDEAANLILSRQIAEGTYRPLFIRAYTGKEPLFFYAAAPWVWMTGGAPWGLRLGAAMIGILTVAATFAATRALAAGHPARSWVALFAAGWLAIAFPHLLLSRYGFRAIAQPLLQALTIAALWRGLRTGRIPWLVAAGLALGLTAYTYLAARLFPIPLALAWAVYLLRTPASARAQRLGHLSLVLTAALVAFAPLGLFFAQNPETFLTRISQVAAPTWSDALHGVGQCLRALIWPNQGDHYIRFNVPGTPVMGPVTAALALIGLVRILVARWGTALTVSGRLFIITAIGVMILPSALATGEITPSNLRMVGIYPMLTMLPAWGLSTLIDALVSSRSPIHPGSTKRRVLIWLSLTLIALFYLGGAGTAWARYRDWASSSALFQATDGEMVLAAEALDVAATDPPVTVYIASEHYRHPTVAALAQHYTTAKWLTGGATLVLPPTGDAVIIVPDSRHPPAPWPAAVAEMGVMSRVSGPDGEVGVTVTHVSALDVTALRAEFGDTEPTADFSHVVWVHDAAPLTSCTPGERCPVMVVWEPRAAATALQPVVRFLHPQTGEWARTLAFHYPSEQWTIGDLVLDQLVLDLPMEMPPGDNYQIGVGFYDPEQDTALSRLVNERFAGFEAHFPTRASGITVAPADVLPSPAQVTAACPGVPRTVTTLDPTLDLLGTQMTVASPVLPGQRIALRLCWQAQVTAPPFDMIELRLRSLAGEEDHPLYMGAPVRDYGFGRWRAGEVLETRYTLQLPRDASAGDYALTLQLDDEVTVDLDTLTVTPLKRQFDLPELAHPTHADFSSATEGLLRLSGYDLSVDAAGETLRVRLVWHTLSEMTQDYVVFVHLRDAVDDTLLTQIDETPQRVTEAGTESYPTSLWVAGEVVTDLHTLPLAERDLSGPVMVYVGLYVPTTGEHLTVAGERRLQLGRLPLAPAE